MPDFFPSVALRGELAKSVHAIANAAGVILANWHASLNFIACMPDAEAICSDVERASAILIAELDRVRALLTEP